MSLFKNRTKLNIVVVVVLAMMLQIVGPTIQGVYAAKAEKTLNIDVRLDGSTAYIDWEFTLDPDNRVGSVTVDGGFILDKDDEINGKLEDEGTVIGDYSISKDGNIIVDMDEDLYDIFDREDEPQNPTPDESNPDEPTEIAPEDEEEPEINDETDETEDTYVEPKTPKEQETPEKPEAPVEPQEPTEQEVPEQQQETEEHEDSEEISFKKSGKSIELASTELPNLVPDDEGNEEEIKTKYSGTIKVDNVSEKFVRPFALNGEGNDPVTFTGVELVFIDENGNKLEEPIPLDAKVEMKFDFKIDDIDYDANTGYVDTTKDYIINIPSEITMTSLLGAIPIYHTDRVTQIGTATIEENKVTVKFLNEVNGFDENRTGWFKANGELVLDELGDGGERTIKVEDFYEKTVKFQTRTEKVTLMKEAGNEAYNAEDNTIEWTIKVKPETNPRGGKIKNVVVNDVIGDGHSYCNYEIVSAHSAIITPDLTGLTFTFDEVEDGKEYVIKIITKLDVSAFNPNDEDKSKEFENTVRGTFGEDSGKNMEPDTETVSVPVDFINKSGKFNGRDGNTITWTININNNNLDMPNGTTLVDNMPEGLELETDTIRIGDKAVSEYEGVTNNSTTTNLELIFTEGLASAANITFDTKITDTNAYNPETNGIYTNTAYLKWTGSDGEKSVGSDEIGVEVGRTVIQKSGNGYDAGDNHFVKWTITVNSSRLDLKNIEVEDTLPKELEYVPSTVTGGSVVPDGWTVTQGEVIEDQPQTIKFKYSGETSSTHTIQLTAKVRDGYKGIYGANKSTTFNNKVTLIDEIIKAPKEADRDETYISKVIEKSGKGYDYKGRVASWEIVVNQNKMTIPNAIVIDVIGENHVFYDEEPLKLGEIELNKVDGKPSINEYSVNGQIIIINLGLISNTETITYKTIIPGDKVNDVLDGNGTKELTNSATLNGDNIIPNGQNDTSKNEITNVLVGKSAQYKKGTDFIDWNIVINMNSQDLGNVTLTDELEEHLILDLATVKLYNLEVDEKGKYKTGDDYNTIGIPIDIDVKYTPDDNNKVIFKLGEINSPYLLVFRTDIDAEELNESITNKSFLLCKCFCNFQ